MKKPSMLVLLLSLISCQEAIDDQEVCSLDPQLETKTDVEGEIEDQQPRVCNTLDLAPEARLKINVTYLNLTDDEKVKMDDAVRRLEIVVNSEEFRNRIIDHKFQEDFKFNNNNDQSNDEIYETIMRAAETLNPEENNTMDLEVEMYYKRNSVVGYTYPNWKKIRVNRRFFSGYRPSQVAANLFHEWTHKIGYDHSYNNNPDRPFSVPYAAGTIVKEMIDSM